MIEAYFDGCCEPTNPGGTAAYGIVILRDGTEVHQASRKFPAGPRTSNNVAEYSGFIAVLEWLIINDLERQPVVVRGDSNLVIQQMFGDWQIREGLYVPLAKRARKLVSRFPMIRGEWVPREQNHLADRLSKQVLIDAGVRFRIQPEGCP